MEPKHIILVIIILFIFQKLINLKKLKSELIKKNLEIEQLQEEKLQSRQKNNYPKRESGIEDQLLTSPDEFYYLKSSCMNRNESRMFYYINCALNEFLSPDQRKNYSVFPQVSLPVIICTSLLLLLSWTAAPTIYLPTDKRPLKNSRPATNLKIHFSIL